jgi:Right handed beta helix region
MAWARVGPPRRVVHGALVVMLLAVAVGFAGTALTRAAKPPPTTCTLVPVLRDVTINQGIGAYSPLVNGKETLVRFYLSMPQCAGSGASIQITGGTLTVSGGTGGTVNAPTPVPVSPNFPVIASFSVAPMTDSTGDPKFVVPGSMLSGSGAFTATFSTTLMYRQRATTSGTYSTPTPITFSTRPGGGAITASVAAPSNPLGVLFVPMGDAARTYSSQWTTTGQQALQDGITAAVARQYPLPAGIGNLGSTGTGFRYSIAPTLLDLGPGGLNLLSAGEFCGTGPNYDLVKGQLAQFLLSHNATNTSARANRVVGVVDPVVAREPPAACFEGMAVVNSQEAWAIATPGKAGQLVGLELAHTLGLTPPTRESPFDGAHSQNITAENPSLNRRYNLVQRSFIPADRSLLKPTATSPAPDNVNTLLEVPDFSFLLCVFGGPTTSECPTYGPGTVTANPPTGATLAFVMSGTHDDTSTATLGLGETGAAAGTSVVESYFASSIQLTNPSPTSTYRLVQRNAGGGVLSDLGVPVTFLHSGHGQGTASETRSSGLFSFALPFNTSTERIELWKGVVGPPGLLLYAQNRTDEPVLSSFNVGAPPIGLHKRSGATSLVLTTYSVTNTGDSGAGSLRQAILDANANPGADTINFSIGTGPQTISPTSALPPITDPVTIDGTTQPGAAAGAPVIELNGASAGASAIGLDVATSDSVIRGLVVNRFFIGVKLFGARNRLEGSFIGTDVAGTAARPNTLYGVQVVSGPDNVVGGTAGSTTRNVISGNGDIGADGGIKIFGTGNKVQGNYIGVDATGTAALGNCPEGIDVEGAGNQIGGTTAGAGNVISANGSPGCVVTGVQIELRGGSNPATSTVVQGNRIGTNAAGTATFPASMGVRLGRPADGTGPSGNTIGGGDSGAANVIAGHSTNVAIDGVATGNLIQGNLIGTNSAGDALGGANGIVISGGTSNSIGGIGSALGNVIAHHGSSGLFVFGTATPPAVRNAIRGNSIFGNGAIGIDLLPPPNTPNGVTPNDANDPDTGGNNLQNFPVLTSAAGGADTTVSGTLDSEASKIYRLEFFSNPSCDSSGNGEGEVFLGSTDVTTDGGGDATFTSVVLPGGSSAGEAVTATATDPDGNTSEFSACTTVSGGGGGGSQPGPTFTVNTNTDPATPVDAGCTTTECTLREAIGAANADGGATRNTIEFDIDGDTQIAVLQGALPALTDDVFIDGLSQPEGTIVINGDGAGEGVYGLQLATGSSGSEIRRLEIRDFFSGGVGIRIESANNTITSNTIHSTSDGISVSGASATGNVIGSDVTPDGLDLVDYDLANTLIQNGSDGLSISSGATGTVVAGNFIGVDDREGTDTDLGNEASGIRVSGASDNQLGPGNTVARNGTIGTGIVISTGTGNRVVANSIHDNLGKGISLSEGNNDLAAPELLSASSSGATTTVSGQLENVTFGEYFVEFFRNAACDSDGAGFGEGETYLSFAAVTVDNEFESFSAELGGLALGDVVTATLTGNTVETNNTSEFSNCVTVQSALPPGQESYQATATDTDTPPGDLRMDLYLVCPGQPTQVLAVGLVPDNVSGQQATWFGNHDRTLTPANCEATAVVTDSFSRSNERSDGVATGPNTLVAAISSPREDATFLQYGLIPFRGLIRDAGTVIASADHHWEVEGPSGFTRSGNGTIFDLGNPPSAGWPVGAYTATLTKPGSTGTAATDTVHFSVLADNDNDGVPASVDNSCLGGGGDSNPLNADDDKDLDGIPNADDPQPCTAASSYTATIDFQPDPFPTPSNGNTVTVYVQVPGRNVGQVLSNTVRIVRFADKDVSTNNDFRNIGWTVSSGVGAAKFDRQKLIAWLANEGIDDQVITVTVRGNSGAPAWSFEGSDTVFITD